MISLGKREKILMAALVPVIIYFLFDQGYFSGWGGIAAAVKTASPVEQIQNPQDELKKFTRVVKGTLIPSFLSWKNDPFFYLNDDRGDIEDIATGKTFGDKAQINPKGFDLEGISWVGKSGMAIIDGNMLKEGDQFRGYTVKNISVKQVTLTKGRETVRLTIND